MILFTFVVMYLTNFTMINDPKDAIFNLNYTYMNILMMSLMIFIDIQTMGTTYNKKLNKFIQIGSIFIAIVSFYFIRNQTFVNDKEFLKSMIPHHSSGVLMAKKILKRTKNEEIKKLAENIIKTQEQEINKMNKLNKLLKK